MNTRPRFPTGPFLAVLAAACTLPLAACAETPYYGGAPGGYQQQPAYGQAGAVYGAPEPQGGYYGQPAYGQAPAYSQPVYSQPAYERPQYAEVISVRPTVRTVETRQQVCSPAPAYPQQGAAPAYGGYTGRDIVGAVVGATAGGVIGHQIGGGRGRDLATVAGALIGAGVGQNVANGPYANPYGQPAASGYGAYGQQVCQEQPTGAVQQADGYDVTYRFRGQLYQTHLPYDPGTRLQVQANGALAGR